ncbi:MAG: hypothetical protein JSU72_10100, partial [Deltaproteobacteria bacterium]
VSTIHFIVAAVVSFGMIHAFIEAVVCGEIMTVVASWVVSPFACAVTAGGICYLVKERIFKSDAARVVEMRWSLHRIESLLVIFVFFLYSLLVSPDFICVMVTI